MHFNRHRGDIGFLDDVIAAHSCGVFVGGVEQERGWCVHQVKNRTQIHRKTLLALANETFALVFSGRAARNSDGVNMLPSVGCVVCNGFGTNVVNWLLKCGIAARLHQRRTCAFATLTAHDVHTVSLVDIQVGVIERADGTRLGERNCHAGVANGQGDRFQVVLEAKLEGDVFLGIAVVVDVNLIQGVGIHLEIVGATVRGLQGLVIGQQGHVIRATARAIGGDAFVAAEHIEVGAVHLGAGSDERGLSVAGGHGTAGSGHQQASLGEAGKFQFHGVSPG